MASLSSAATWCSDEFHSSCYHPSLNLWVYASLGLYFEYLFVSWCGNEAIPFFFPTLYPTPLPSHLQFLLLWCTAASPVSSFPLFMEKRISVASLLNCEHGNDSMEEGLLSIFLCHMKGSSFFSFFSKEPLLHCLFPVLQQEVTSLGLHATCSARVIMTFIRAD